MKVQDRINLFIKKFGFQPEAFEVCPRFERCSVNLCPLDSNMKLRTYAEEDQEKKCLCPKAIRKPIGLFFKLKNKGLKEREIAGLRIWENMTPEEREAKKEKLRKSSLIIRLSKKGYGINKVKGKQSPVTLANEVKTLVATPGGEE